jgi:phosphate transport system substrate-binding protein
MAAGVAASLFLLGACGSDANTANSPSPVAGVGQSVDCVSGTFNGAGSSAQKPAVVAWTAAYQRLCPDVAFNYDAQGSNNGRTQFIQKQVPLAGSDAYLVEPQKTQAQQRCAPGTAVDLPMVITPIAVVYNLPGVDKLTLTPVLVAKIFDGKITRWNDAGIAAANPGASLPDRTITPVHRSADSGTSENLTRFLVAQAPQNWPYKASQAWPNSVGLGASVSTTMVGEVKNTNGAIGYVDNPDAVKNGLPAAAMDTGFGPVKISPEAVAAVVDATKVNQNGQDITLDLAYNLKMAGAYPVLLTTYEITCTQGLPADQARFVKSFLSFVASDAGQGVLGEQGYIRLPKSLQDKVSAATAQLGT